MIAVLALIGQAFLESGNERSPAPALCLSKPVCGLAQFVRVRNLLASRESEKRMKAGINAYSPISRVGNMLRWRVNEQAEIPSRRPLDETAAFDPALGKVLGMKPHMPYPWNVDTCASGRGERIREWDARQLVAPTFELGLPGQFLTRLLYFR